MLSAPRRTCARAFQSLPARRRAHQPVRRGRSVLSVSAVRSGEDAAGSGSGALVSFAGAMVGWAGPWPGKKGAGSRTVERRRGCSACCAGGSLGGGGSGRGSACCGSACCGSTAASSRSGSVTGGRSKLATATSSSESIVGCGSNGSDSRASPSRPRRRRPPRRPRRRRRRSLSAWASAVVWGSPASC